jgi:thiol-disulfide isomerase/thioredoxin
MIKLIITYKKYLALGFMSLLISTFISYTLINITPLSSIAASNQSSITSNRTEPSASLLAGDPGRPISNSSGRAEIGLAKHLTKKRVKMYGAFWCGYCAKQKELFGKQAFAKIKYIECDERGVKPQRNLCNQAGVNGYPTWKFPNGQTAGGLTSLSALADASGYRGARNFKN